MLLTGALLHPNPQYYSPTLSYFTDTWVNDFSLANRPVPFFSISLKPHSVTGRKEYSIDVTSMRLNFISLEPLRQHNIH